MKQLGSYMTDFHKNLYLSIFRKSVSNIQVSLKSDKNDNLLDCRVVISEQEAILGSTRTAHIVTEYTPLEQTNMTFETDVVLTSPIARIRVS